MKPKADRWPIFKQFLIIFVPLALLAATISWVNHALTWGNHLAVMKTEERGHIRTVAETVGLSFKSVHQDLRCISRGGLLKAVVNGGDAETRQTLAEHWVDISKTKAVYDQIRYLDEDGRETVRVNYNNDSPTAVPEHKLQDKSQRYYFPDAFVLNRGEVFVSPLDLNIERGEIERPLKPMLRFGTPVYDDTGRKRGIVLLNYLAHRVLARVKHVHSDHGHSPMLLNQDGYWLAAGDPADEWGFMFNNERRFQNRNPAAWETIATEETGQFATPDGIYTFLTIYPLSEGQVSSTGATAAFAPSQASVDPQSYRWKLVAFLSQQALAERHRGHLFVDIMLLAVLLTLVLAASGIIASLLQRRKAAEQALIEAEKTAAKSQLAYQMTGGVAHEFNNLLAIIKGNLGFLGQTVGDDAKAKKRIEAAARAADRGASLTRQMLSLSQQRPIRPERVDVNALIQGMDEIFQCAGAAGIEFQTALGPHLWQTETDPGEFKDALAHLVRNACQAMPNGGQFSIETRNASLGADYVRLHPSAVAGEFVQTTVRDRGVGMSEQELEHAFDPFYTGRPVGEGAGLGLSVAKGFVERSGGHLRIETRPGEGTAVHMYLPRVGA